MRLGLEIPEAVERIDSGDVIVKVRRMYVFTQKTRLNLGLFGVVAFV